MAEVPPGSPVRMDYHTEALDLALDNLLVCVRNDEGMGDDMTAMDVRLALSKVRSLFAALRADTPVTEPEKTTGPGAWLRRVAGRFDRLFSLDHKPARDASEEYDEAFHDAVQALKDLRQFADIIAPTWRAASTLLQREPIAESCFECSGTGIADISSNAPFPCAVCGGLGKLSAERLREIDRAMGSGDDLGEALDELGKAVREAVETSPGAVASNIGWINNTRWNDARGRIESLVAALRKRLQNDAGWMYAHELEGELAALRSSPAPADLGKMLDELEKAVVVCARETSTNIGWDENPRWNAARSSIERWAAERTNERDFQELRATTHLRTVNQLGAELAALRAAQLSPREMAQAIDCVDIQNSRHLGRYAVVLSKLRLLSQDAPR